MMTILTTLLIALTLALGGSGATVLAAQNSLPNDALYPVKVFSEDLQLKLRTDAEDQFNLLLAFSGRRFEEIQALAGAGEPIQQRTAERLQEQLHHMLQLAAGMEDDALHRALIRVRATLQQHDQELTSLIDDGQCPDHPLLTRLRERLREQQRLVDAGLSAPNLFRQRLNAAGNHPGEYPERTPQSGGGNRNGPDNGPGPGPEHGAGPGPQNRTAQPTPTETPTPTPTGTPEVNTGGPGPGPGGDGENNGPGPGEPQPGHTNTPKHGDDDDKGDGPKDPGKKDPGDGGGQGGKP